jgi:cytochrome c biogenesis factor
VKSFLKTLWRIAAACSFTILASFCGVGLAGMTVLSRARHLSKAIAEKAMMQSEPMLIAGGLIGLTAGIIISTVMLKVDTREVEELEREQISTRGQLYIYFGLPVFLIVLLAPVFGVLVPLGRANADPFIYLAAVLAILALSLLVYDRISAPYRFRIGIVGWLLALFILIFFFPALHLQHFH